MVGTGADPRNIFWTRLLPQPAWKAFRDFLTDLVNKKQAAPAEPLGNETDKATAVGLWSQFLAPLQATNATVKSIALLINNYKTLTQRRQRPRSCNSKFQILQATKRRYDPPGRHSLSQIWLLQGRMLRRQTQRKKAAKRSIRGADGSDIGQISDDDQRAS